MATPDEMSDASEDRGRRMRVLVTALILLLLAAVIRFLHLGAWSFWADEVATLRDAQELHKVAGYPVGYALIGWTVKLLGIGPTEFAGRLLPAVVGAISVCVIFLIGRRIFSERAGVLAGVFLALSCYHLFFSQFARYYTLLMLLGLLGMWAAYWGIERNNKAWLIGAVVLLGLGFWTHWSAALLLPALGVYLLWAARRASRPDGLTLANVAILFGPFVLGGLMLLPRLMEFLTLWRGGADFSPARALWFTAKLLYRLDAALLICAVIGVWVLLRQGDRRAKWLLTFAAVPVLLLTVFVAFSKGGSRFGIVVLPPVVLLAAATLDALLKIVPQNRKKLALAVVGLVVVALLIKDVRYFTVEKGQRPRWREAVQYVSDLRCERGEGPVFPPPNAMVPTAVLAATSPEVVAHYGAGCALQLCVLGNAKHHPFFVARRNMPPTYVLVEHVANVAPTPEQMAVIEKHTTLVKRWPLHIGPMDYSISLYSNERAISEISPH